MEKVIVMFKFVIVVIALLINTAPPAYASTLDNSFVPNVNNVVRATAIQADGKILIGGIFTNVAGVTRNHIARLNADGSLDTGFNPNPNGHIFAIAVQANGRILVSGSFNTIAGVEDSDSFVRLNSDGSLDATFSLSYEDESIEVEHINVLADETIIIAGTSSISDGFVDRLFSDGSRDIDYNPNVDTDSTVFALAVQPDGKVMAGKTKHRTINPPTPQDRNGIVRFNSDGSLDTVFNPNANGEVRAIAVQPHGKIFIGGTFDSVGGIARSGIARLNIDGSLDTTFNPELDGIVGSINELTNGKVLIKGNFLRDGSYDNNGLTLLNAGGDIITNFDSIVDYSVLHTAVQADGSILISGFFGPPSNRTFMARLSATESALESIYATPSQFYWLRRGGAPEIERTTLEISQLGINFSPPIAGRRIGDSWSFQAPNIQQGTQITARLRGYYNNGGSQSIAETIQQVSVLPDNDELCIPIKAEGSNTVTICL